MNKSTAKKIIMNILTPKYELARDSAIEWCIKDRDIIINTREILAELRCKDKSNSIEYQELYSYLYGYYDKLNRKQVKGFISNLNKNNFKLIMDRVYSKKKMITDREIVSFYKKEYNRILKDVTNSIYDEIKSLDPKNIELGLSKHDINFILTFADRKRSYTINTIVAGGEIQCIHNRVLKNLHKGVV